MQFGIIYDLHHAYDLWIKEVEEMTPIKKDSKKVFIIKIVVMGMIVRLNDL